jgi:mannose-6-phosphate isomerase
MANNLYPLKFTPIYKDKIWGGHKIKSSLGLDFGNLPNCGEAWMVSGYNGQQTVVANGFLAGNELNEIVEIYMGDLVGDKVYDEFGDEFPLLIKFLNANDWLSIQVHPDDEFAAKKKIGRGKSEMWYVLEADEGSQLISGFNREITREEYLKHFDQKNLREILNYETVKKGDAFDIPPGRIHSLGPGILLAEIQQTSDATFRIYDWDRVGADGLLRELHTDLALEAIDFKHYIKYKTSYKEEINRTTSVIKTPYFTTNTITLEKAIKKDYEELDSFVIFMGIEGKATIKWNEGEITLAKGEAIVIPNTINILELFPEKKSKLLEIYIP